MLPGDNWTDDHIRDNQKGDEDLRCILETKEKDERLTLEKVSGKSAIGHNGKVCISIIVDCTLRGRAKMARLRDTCWLYLRHASERLSRSITMASGGSSMSSISSSDSGHKLRVTR